MINRDQLRLEKQRECEERLEVLYQKLPELRVLDQNIGKGNVAMIRAGVLRKNRGMQQKLQKEIDHAMQERHQLLQKHGLNESIYEPRWNCPKCQDRGYIEPGVLCSCYQQERLQELFLRSGMANTMQNLTFDTFQCDRYNNPEKMAQKVAWCKQFASQIEKGTCRDCLFLTGLVGRGKTHLAAAIANEVLQSGKVVLYRRASDLFDLLREYRFGNEKEKCSIMLEQLRSCDLLVIDDLGAERTTDFVIEQLVILLEERDLRKKPWIITSNLNINEIKEAYNDRTTDRILDRAVIFRLDRATSVRQDRAVKRMEQF